MAPPYVFRALAFGCLAAAIVAGADFLAADVFGWAWFQDPAHVRFTWPPPHVQEHKTVLALSALGALAGMHFDRTAPLRWPVVVAAAVVFGLLTLAGAPISSFIWGWLGLIGWLVLGAAGAMVLAEVIAAP